MTSPMLPQRPRTDLPWVRARVVAGMRSEDAHASIVDTRDPPANASAADVLRADAFDTPP
jgi:hypothetical protein